MIVLRSPEGHLLGVVKTSREVGHWQQRHPEVQAEAWFVVHGERGFVLKPCVPEGMAL